MVVLQNYCVVRQRVGLFQPLVGSSLLDPQTRNTDMTRKIRFLAMGKIDSRPLLIPAERNFGCR